MTSTQKTIVVGGLIAFGIYLFRKKPEVIVDVPFEEIKEDAVDLTNSLVPDSLVPDSLVPDIQSAYGDATNSLYQPYSEGAKTNTLPTNSEAKKKPYPDCSTINGYGKKSASREVLKNVCLI